MTNGDAAVFSNYFVISEAPTFKQVSYTSGTNRIVADNVAQSTLSTAPTAGFNTVGNLPRGATRRVLITGTGFTRGSFAPFKDPLKSTSSEANAAAANDTACTNCFGARSGETLVGAASLSTTTPKIEFSNAGVSVSASLTTVVRNAGEALAMASTSGQSTDLAQPYVATNRLTAVVSVTADASAGPVTMTITNPDGGKVVVPNAFIVDGTPTIDVTKNAVITGATIDSTSDASIKQGEQKTVGNAIFIYGSGFFGVPQVSVSGTGVRVTSVRLTKTNPGTTAEANDAGMPDTVMRVELAAESTAPTGTRNITVVLPDGQSVTKTGAFRVDAP
jgi:hypothetical protein